jgi:hypothetical protein
VRRCAVVVTLLACRFDGCVSPDQLYSERCDLVYLYSRPAGSVDSSERAAKDRRVRAGGSRAQHAMPREMKKDRRCGWCRVYRQSTDSIVYTKHYTKNVNEGIVSSFGSFRRIFEDADQGGPKSRGPLATATTNAVGASTQRRMALRQHETSGAHACQSSNTNPPCWRRRWTRTTNSTETLTHPTKNSTALCVFGPGFVLG